MKVVLPQVAGQPPTTEMLVVFGIILLAFLLFVTEPVPADATALVAMVTLIVLEPWTTITPEEGISGFSNPATITVLAMFVISEGVRRSGAVQVLSSALISVSRGSERRSLASIVGVSGLASGFINNTPVVAVMIPVASDLARSARISPSRLLIPVSFASMFGGMLTLIGTSTNILASDVSARLIGRPFSMFEFTALGAIVLVTGGLYLIVVGPWLIPERVRPEEPLTEEYETEAFLTEVAVGAESPFTGRTVEEVRTDPRFDDVEIVQLVRDGEWFGEPLANKTVRAADVLVVRTPRRRLLELLDVRGLSLRPGPVTDADLERATDERLVEVMVMPETSTIGEGLTPGSFRDSYDATVLALRRSGEPVERRLEDVRLRGGDTLLVQAAGDGLDRLQSARGFVVSGEVDRPEYRRSKIPVVLAIVLGVVVLAALEVAPILVTALGGVVAMVLTGCLKPAEVYEGIDWSVIFLLAGVIPLGIALERTGGAEWIAALVVSSSATLPTIAVLGVFYLLTALLTNVISNNASVVLMIPVGVDAAIRIGADPFAFVLAVTFAASTAILSPIGYQTNLMVYGPGGYRFTDFFRVGAPLQLVLAVVTTLGIAAIWGV
ncbi:SLC13 family permease [Halalkalicoccus ordinarius]|uniref:SLC13 family permease n=1 Tax=Halalkalicoccus ordinarius TaxID=3116651 RepID=UPI00300F0FD4